MSAPSEQQTASSSTQDKFKNEVEAFINKLNEMQTALQATETSFMDLSPLQAATEGFIIDKNSDMISILWSELASASKALTGLRTLSKDYLSTLERDPSAKLDHDTFVNKKSQFTNASLTFYALYKHMETQWTENPIDQGSEDADHRKKAMNLFKEMETQIETARASLMELYAKIHLAERFDDGADFTSIPFAVHFPHPHRAQLSEESTSLMSSNAWPRIGIVPSGGLLSPLQPKGSDDEQVDEEGTAPAHGNVEGSEGHKA